MADDEGWGIAEGGINLIAAKRQIWQKATRDHPCPVCGHANRCNISPDGTAVKCWRDGGRVHRLNGHRGNGNGHIHKPDPAPSKPARTFLTAEDAMVATAPPGGRLVHTFKYPNDEARVGRFDFADGHKEFRPVHQVANGWCIGDPPEPLPLYRHDELPTDGRVYVAEGEKCTDRAWSLGLPCVASMHGSSAPHKSDWSRIANRDVVILIDSDAAGRKYGRVVAQILNVQECTVRVVDLFPELNDGSDIVDFDDAIGSEAEATRAEIDRLVDAAKIVPILERGLSLTRADSVQRSDVKWAWRGWLPYGKLVLVFGYPAVGKGSLVTSIAATLSNGGNWPDGTQAPLCSTLILSKEDDAGDTMAPRLDAAGADSRKIYFLDRVIQPGENGDMISCWFTLDMIEMVRDTLRKHPDIRLLVIDPPASHMPEKLSDNNQAHVRSLLGPWADLAQEFHIIVLLVMHRPKNGSAKAVSGAIGSGAWLAASRVAILIARDSEDPSLRLMLCAKNNLSAPPPNRSFKIAGPVAHVEWVGEIETSADDVTAADALGKPGPEPKKLEAAKEWLAAELKDLQPMAVETLKANAKAASLVWRTIQRASALLRVKVERCQFGGGYSWRLPKI